MEEGTGRSHEAEAADNYKESGFWTQAVAHMDSQWLCQRAQDL